MNPPSSAVSLSLSILIGMSSVPSGSGIASSDEIRQSPAMIITCRERQFQDYLDGPSVRLQLVLFSPAICALCATGGPFEGSFVRHTGRFPSAG